MLLPDKVNLECQVSEIMEKRVVILDESTSVGESALIMKKRGISSILVKDHNSNAIKGIVTERDILYRVVAQAKGTFKINLGSVMSSPLVTIEKETPGIEAYDNA